MYRTPSSREKLVPLISHGSSEKYSITPTLPEAQHQGQKAEKKKNWCMFSWIRQICSPSTKDGSEESLKQRRRRRMMMGAGISAAVTA